jgi:hypothetical protein
LPSLSMERTTSFSVRNFHGTVSMGGIDQTHRSAAKSKTRKCIISFSFWFADERARNRSLVVSIAPTRS